MSLNHQTKLIECDHNPCRLHSTSSIFLNVDGAWTWFNINNSNKDICPECKEMLIELYGDSWKEFILWK